jgi:hypothetical protein
MTDRLMTPRLAAALDALTEAERRYLKTIAPESAHPWLRALLEALVAEVIVTEAHEVTTLHEHELDRLRDVEAASEAADWPTEPEDRTKGVAWFPEAAPDDVSGLDDEPGHGNVEP